jgi:acetyltransferase-like isoleucine patch superfamily enzyme
MSIGARVYIGQHCNIRAGGGQITIGDNVLMANGVSIIATNHGMEPGTPMINQPSRTDIKDVFVGSDVWIGAHAVLLPGCRVESGSIVAAGAVVTGVVPENTIFGGVPARQIGMRGPGLRHAPERRPEMS